MLDIVDKKINFIRSFSINSRGQPRRGEYQMDDPLWLDTWCCGGERKETNLVTYTEQKT